MSSVRTVEDDGRRVAPLVELSPEQRSEMERLARLPTLPARVISVEDRVIAWLAFAKEIEEHPDYSVSTAERANLDPSQAFGIADYFHSGNAAICKRESQDAEQPAARRHGHFSASSIVRPFATARSRLILLDWFGNEKREPAVCG